MKPLARFESRKVIGIELPLLCPLGRSNELPEIVNPDRGHETASEIRPRAGKLEPKPFLETMPVYRYLPEHR